MSGLRRSTPDLGTVPTLVWVGLAIGGGFVALAVLMVVGSGLTDPGGLTGVGIALGVLVPLLVLCTWALVRPDHAVVGLAVLALAPVGFGVWQLLDNTAAWAFEERNGPLSLVLVLVVATPAIVLGLSRARAAGVLLLVVTLVPTVLATVGAMLAGTSPFQPLSVALLSAPLVVAGLLYVLAPPGRDQGRTGSVARWRPSTTIQLQ